MQKRVEIIMLKLKNISRTDEYIEANYFPEGTDEAGYVQININNGEIISKQITSHDEVTEMYFEHACSKLWDMRNDEMLPDERLVMCY